MNVCVNLCMYDCVHARACVCLFVCPLPKFVSVFPSLFLQSIQYIRVSGYRSLRICVRLVAKFNII